MSGAHRLALAEVQKTGGKNANKALRAELKKKSTVSQKCK